MSDPLIRARALFPFTRSLRREFHRHPELGFQEFHTSEIILRELSNLETFTVQSEIAGTGILATLEGEKPGQTILLRFDMDGLPILERTGAAYASQNEGLMHACGHDGHMAIGLTCARLLEEYRAELSGTVKILFQPAEEGLGGAMKTIQAGVLQDPRPDMALGMHLWNEKPLGWLGIGDGAVMSAAEIFKIKIVGKGAHGASPEEAVDPIVASADLISAVQTLISREIHPQDSAVISICTLRAGEAHNVIPSEVLLTGTMRTFSAATRAYLLERLETLADNVAAAHRCRAELSFEDISPAVVNDPQISAAVRDSARRLFPGAELDESYRTMISEDMAHFLNEIPGCFSLIGSSNPENGLDAKHHQPDFDFDEEVLITATALMVRATLDLLQP